jgi:hypothetical protein
MSQMLRSSGQVRRASLTPRKVADSPALPEPAGEEELEAILGEVPSSPLTQAEAEPTIPAFGGSEVYGGLVEAAQEVFVAAAQSGAPDEGRIIGAVRQALGRLREDDGLLAEIVRQREEGRDWPQRAANTSVLAMRLGLELEYDQRRCLAIGLCALMHDLGMLKVPQEVLESPSLTGQQRELLRQHPLESQRLVQGFGQAFAWIGKTVAQAHERQDGSGYPRGLKGDQIHPIARIIGLADAYEAMAHPRADRKARATYDALKELIDLRNSLFDRRLLKSLINIVSIFPLGSLVKLNNGEIGRVIGISRSHPTRPRLEILVDSRGRRLPAPRVLVLEEEPMVYIVDPGIEERVLNPGK